MNLEQFAKPIPNTTLKTVWKQISDNPLPNVFAFRFPDCIFSGVLEKILSNKGVVDRWISEYRESGNGDIEACTFELKGRLVILIKESAMLADCLEHELQYVKDRKS